jgi:hypothetical protein
MVQVWVNWRIRIFALLASVAELLSQQGITIASVGKTDVVKLSGLLGLLMIAFFAKDKEKTGGTVPSTPEAVVRVEAGPKALDPAAVEKVALKVKQP